MRTLRVLNLGAGVQSTYLFLQDDIPYDAVIFADTQGEPAAVYRHLDWLDTLGRYPILRATAGDLGSDLRHGRNSSGQRFVSIPCFTKAVGDAREGRTKRQCTKEYKTSVVERVIRYDVLGLRFRQKFPTQDVHVLHYLGLSADEAGRAARVARNWKTKWSEPVFPLLDRGIRRGDCQEWLKTRVPHPVRRSACVFCPFHRNEEWRELRETDPAGWQQAVALDAALRLPGTVATRSMAKPMYLHRSCVPLDMVDLDEGGQSCLPFGATECSGFCGN